MKKFLCWMALVAALFVGFAGGRADAQPGDREDRTESPYFFVAGGDPDTDCLPLESTTARVTIAGVLADVVVTQVYKNDGKKPLEAIYIFPASTRAAVYGMKMTIGKRVIEAKIKKRDEARREYEQARDAGKNASLLEQHRPNVFQMNVANIMPGDRIFVELRYTELLVPTDRIYEFVYPTVAGPRYAGAKEGGSASADRWVANPYLRQGERSATTFDISVAIKAGMPIRDLACPTHKVNIAYESAAGANVTLSKGEAHGGNRDYILRYRLDGNKIQTGLLLSQGEKENFFVLLMQPPKRVTDAQIPGREYIFVVDVSGSMHGFPLSVSKKLLADLIGRLRPTDTFNVLLFSGGSTLMAEESLPATRSNIARAISVIDRQRGGGGTELLPALRRALTLKREEGVARSIILVTDGYVSVEEEAFDLIRTHLASASLFAFGIGSSVNRHLMEGLAHVGGGEPFIVTKPDEAPGQAERFRKMIATPVLTQVQVEFRGFDACDIEPVSVPDVLAERPVLVFGKWRGKPQGTIRLTGIAGGGPYSETVDVAAYRPAPENAALKYLWARHRIMILSDYNKLRGDEKRVKEVTDLGLAYNLLTAYTSFVAVDSEVRNRDGKPTTVKQPLPLPEGVSDYAVGNSMSAAAPAVMEGMGLRGKSTQYAFSDKSYKREIAAPQKKDRIVIDRLTVGKGLAEDAVRKVVLAGVGDIEKCLAGKNVAGKVKISLTIGADGAVAKTTIDDGGALEAATRRCLADAVKKWFFPAPGEGRSVQVVITLKL